MMIIIINQYQKNSRYVIQSFTSVNRSYLFSNYNLLKLYLTDRMLDTIISACYCGSPDVKILNCQFYVYNSYLRWNQLTLEVKSYCYHG